MLMNMWKYAEMSRHIEVKIKYRDIQYMHIVRASIMIFNICR
jgi:hypothetical protein